MRSTELPRMKRVIVLNNEKRRGANCLERRDAIFSLLCQWCLLLPVLTPQKKSRKENEKKIEKKNPKKQEDTHEENLKHCTSWWLKTKMTCELVEGPKCIKLEKLTTQFWWTKVPFNENIFIWCREIQIWTSKNSMKILKDLINFIDHLIARKIKFLESIWVVIWRNWS